MKDSNFKSVADYKQYLASLRVKPKYLLGQNFLWQDEYLDRIVESAELKKGEVVLEVGPGLGALTEKLLREEVKVLAIEKDPELNRVLKVLQVSKDFKLVFGDAIKFDFNKKIKEEFDTDHYKVVANIPYYATNKLIQVFLEARIKPESITILVQKEVAENIIAPPGRLSLAALGVIVYGEPKLLSTVPRSAFYPVPKVDSAILHIDVYSSPKIKWSTSKSFFKVAKGLFAGKRKQLHNTLANLLHIQKDKAQQILLELEINPSLRPQELTLKQWQVLYDKISRIQIAN